MTDSPEQEPTAPREKRRFRTRIAAVLRWWPLPVCAFTGAAAGVAYAVAVPPEYAATNHVVAVAAKDAPPGAALGFAQAYGRLATGDSTIAYARVAAGLPARVLRTRVRAETSPDSPMIAITGTSRRPAEAADIANAVADAVFVSANQVAKSTGVQLVGFSQAIPPREPVSAGPRLAAAVEEAAEEGADVITVTAPLDGSDPAVRAAMAAAARHDSLVVVPAAADTEPRGGSAVPPAPVPPPGALAVVDTGPRGDRAAESPAYSRADLTAPGGSLVGPGPVGDGKWTASGSSLAAALTAGTAALVRSYHPDLSAAEVRERMLSGAYPGTVLPALDPYGAVSGVARPAAAAVPAGERPVALPKPSDTSGQRSTALLVVAVSVGVVVLVAFLAVVLPRGRARGWRPGRWETADRPGA
ncbi:S8 family serine peptidase [Streptomyces clavuligerus]|uniref:S8 family serine peptidase n=1 Tax=Streptomyces clavuligerus TaxID=1901 RepID=UPI0018D1D75D|nr:S8 family serine peptidase [Streptomyces clavuligerus]